MKVQLKKTRKLVTAGGIATVAALSFGSSAFATGSWHPISGAVGWTCSTWYTSSNLRYVSSGGSAIKVNLSSTGVGGVQFRVKNENTGLTSSVAYIPPLNTAQTLTGTWSGGTPFRNQFRCVNSDPNHGSTDFNGSEFY
jgi:hypothetical protein